MNAPGGKNVNLMLTVWSTDSSYLWDTVSGLPLGCLPLTEDRRGAGKLDCVFIDSVLTFLNSRFNFQFFFIGQLHIF